VFCKLFDNTCTTTLWDFQTCNFFSNIVFTFARITFIKVLWWNENLFTLCLGRYFFSNYMFINILWHTQCFFHNIAYLQAQLDFCTFTHKHILNYLQIFQVQFQVLQHLEILFKLHFMIVNNPKIYTCFFKQWFSEKGHMFVSPKVLECYMHIRCT
jgi:hypothetical protein